MTENNFADFLGRVAEAKESVADLNTDQLYEKVAGELNEDIILGISQVIQALIAEYSNAYLAALMGMASKEQLAQLEVITYAIALHDEAKKAYDKYGDKS